MKILLAEDEEQLSRVLVAAMQSVNYEVDPVFNGRDAVELAKKNSYDGHGWNHSSKGDSQEWR